MVTRQGVVDASTGTRCNVDAGQVAVSALFRDCIGVGQRHRVFRIVSVDTATIGHRFYIRIQMTLVKFPVTV